MNKSVSLKVNAVTGCEIRSCTLVARALTLWCFLAVAGMAQTYSISGRVSDTAGHAVPSATVTAKSVATGKTAKARTNTNGVYTIPELAAGDYNVSAVAGELQAPPVRVTVAAAETTDLTVSPKPRKRKTRKRS
jgi:hypothetical protein